MRLRIGITTASLTLSLCAHAGPPPSGLTIVEASFLFKDFPTCEDISNSKKICTWHAPNDEFFTCIVSDTDSTLNEIDCVFITKESYRYEYFDISEPAITITERRKKRSGMEQLAKAKEQTGPQSSLLGVTTVVGHGPAQCLLSQTLMCEWESNNDSPGHHNSVRYLAEDTMHVPGNPPIRLICEFDVETLARTDTECVATSF